MCNWQVFVAYKIVPSSALKELISRRLSTMTQNIRQMCDQGTLVVRAERGCRV